MQTFEQWLETNYSPWGTIATPEYGNDPTNKELHQSQNKNEIERILNVANKLDYMQLDVLIRGLQELQKSKLPAVA